MQDLVGFAGSTILQLQGAVNWLNWSNVVGYLALALAYGYFLVVRPDNS